MIEILKNKFIYAAVLLLAMMAIVFSPQPASAQLFSECAGTPSAELCKVVNEDKTTAIFGSDSLISNVIELIIFITGGVAVLMIAIGGLRYVLSSGDPQGAQTAKNTVLYAVIGLILALSAEVILKFVLERL